jgi:hypothetical protein
MIRGPNRGTEWTREGCAVCHVAMRETYSCPRKFLVSTAPTYALRRMLLQRGCFWTRTVADCDVNLPLPACSAERAMERAFGHFACR